MPLLKAGTSYAWFRNRLSKGGTRVSATLQTFGAQLAVTMINILTGILTARLLGPEGRGLLAVLTLWPQLLGHLAGSAFASGLVYYLKSARDTGAELTGA